MKQHIFQAVESRHLQIFEDLDFRFVNVAPIAMLDQLKGTYGKVTLNNVETNCNFLLTEWSPEDLIENIWLGISKCQVFA